MTNSTRYVRCPSCGGLYEVVTAVEARDMVASFNDPTIKFADFLHCRICGADSTSFEDVAENSSPLGGRRPIVMERDEMTPPDRDTADRLHAALTAAGARGSVRVLDAGQWVVRLMRGQSRQGLAFPPAGQEREEWLAAMLDRLEAVAGVRPELETED